MEQRRHPRIQLPLLVELRHPSLGNLRCIARDISEGGVFVYTDNPQIKPGAKVRITLQNTLGVETQPTPTVDMEVKRVENDGLGLAFVNVAGRHLWRSVERIRSELAVGRDYFQVHLNALVINDSDAVLVVQQHGKWTLPACFLVVGEDWRQAVTEFLRHELDVAVERVGEVRDLSSLGDPELPEAAVLDLFVEVRATGDKARLTDSSRYRASRWISRRRDVEEATFAGDRVRVLIEAALKRLLHDEGNP
ncbi:MAG: PilZ domain-containing protein [Pseudomonadales bacterium]